MEQQFTQIIDNLDENETKTEEKNKKAPVEKEIPILKNEPQSKGSVYFRFFMILLVVAIILLGFVITQICFLALK